MSALVGYASSDEDENQPAKPSKIARLSSEDGSGSQRTNEIIEAHPAIERLDERVTKGPQYGSTVLESDRQPLGPAQGPSASIAPVENGSATPLEPPLSPYTTERLRVRELTMPPAPNFDIPDAPLPPPANSEEAAVLAATTKKFERFLELKKQGVHFNERLQNSASLRNPSVLPKLMEFAGVCQEDSYVSTLSDSSGGVPVKWPEACYVEGLIKQSERREKKRQSEREKVDFVLAAPKNVTPGASGAPSSSGGGRRSRFDQK